MIDIIVAKYKKNSAIFNGINSNGKLLKNINTTPIIRDAVFIFPLPIAATTFPLLAASIFIALTIISLTTITTGIITLISHFEAKETNNKTSFPLENIHKHQIKHIRNIVNNNGICFLIVRFTSLNKTYMLMGIDFINFIDNYSRKSIPLEYFNERGQIIELSYVPRLDYLKVLNRIDGGNNNGK